MHNKLLLPENKRPRGLKYLAELARENPRDFERYHQLLPVGRYLGPRPVSDLSAEVRRSALAVDGYDCAVSSPGNIGWALTLQKLAAGEYKVAYFASGVVVFPKTKDAAMQKVMEWRFMEDAQPLWVRPVVIPKDGSSPNSARLMIDFIVSHDGQAAFGRGGLTPYRSMCARKRWRTSR